MNSVLQCLLRAKPFIDLLDEEPCLPNSLLDILSDLVDVMLQSESTSPFKFYEKIKVIHPQFAGGNQEDCQEFLVNLLFSLDEEKMNNSSLRDIFGVTVSSTLSCKVCASRSTTFDNTWGVSLPLTTNGECLSSLLDSLQEFEREESLEGDNLWMCNSCNKKSARKR